MKWYDYVFPFGRAALELRHSRRAALWFYLLALTFGPGIALALLHS